MEKRSIVSHLHEAARLRLNEYLLPSSSETGGGLPADVRDSIAVVINGNRKTFRYMLFVGLLVAVTDRRYHPRCLQLKARDKLVATGKEAFDARSLCKNVVVPFEKEILKGRIGGSCDPYVSNPARLPMVEPGNDVKGGLDQKLLNRLYDVLEFANGADDVLRKKMFSFAYAQVLKRPPTETSLLDFGTLNGTAIMAGNFFDFLESPTQGASAVAVLAAYFRIYYGRGTKVVVHPITESGASSREVGDIDLKLGNGTECAVEVKDKPYKEVDVNHACEKALQAGVSKVVFAFGPQAEKKRPPDGILRNFWIEKGVELLFLSISAVIGVALTISDDAKRSEFAMAIGDALSEMNAPDGAKQLFKTIFQKATA